MLTWSDIPSDPIVGGGTSLVAEDARNGPHANRTGPGDGPDALVSSSVTLSASRHPHRIPRRPHWIRSTPGGVIHSHPPSSGCHQFRPLCRQAADERMSGARSDRGCSAPASWVAAPAAAAAAPVPVPASAVPPRRTVSCLRLHHSFAIAYIKRAAKPLPTVIIETEYMSYFAAGVFGVTVERRFPASRDVSAGVLVCECACAGVRAWGRSGVEQRSNLEYLFVIALVSDGPDHCIR